MRDIAEYAKNRIDADRLSTDTYVGVDNLLPDKKGKTASVHVPAEGKVNAYEMGNVLIGNIRPYLRKIWYANNNGGANGDVLVIRALDKKIILPKYLFYVLASEQFFLYDINNSKGAKMPRGDKNAIMEYVISLPAIKEQERIIKIFDRFESLCHDLSEGLPAEIEARKKQYGHYRDKLLTFKELSK